MFIDPRLDWLCNAQGLQIKITENEEEGIERKEAFFFFFLVFLGPNLRLIEVSRQRQIQTTSAIYTTTHGTAGSLTHWERPGIEPKSSWILVWFVTTEPHWELHSKEASYKLLKDKHQHLTLNEAMDHMIGRIHHPLEQKSWKMSCIRFTWKVLASEFLTRVLGVGLKQEKYYHEISPGSVRSREEDRKTTGSGVKCWVTDVRGVQVHVRWGL